MTVVVTECMLLSGVVQVDICDTEGQHVTVVVTECMLLSGVVQVLIDLTWKDNM